MKLEARKTALKFISKIFRDVLREAAIEALRRLLIQRFHELKDNNNTGSNSDNDRNKNNAIGEQTMNRAQTDLDELHVSLSDIDYCYNVAIRLGEKWEVKLLDADEKDAASIVRHVLSTGRFLEEDVVDEFPSPTTLSLSSRPLSIRRSHGDMTSYADAKHRPYEILQNLGWKWDLSQSIDEAFPSSELKPTSSEWKPLPSYEQDSSSTVHIPKAAILPVHEIKTQNPHQLYGYPSSSFNMSNAQNRLLSNNGSTDFYHDQINHMDESFSTADEMNQPTSWYHGWECIQNAVSNNRDRMYLETIAGRKRKHPISMGLVDLETEHHAIIPKSLITQRNSNQQNHQDESMVSTIVPTEAFNHPLETSATSIVDLTIVPTIKVISSNTRVAILLDEKRQHTSWHKLRQEEVQSTLYHVREPSSISTESWTIDDIQHELSDLDEQKLISMINQNKEEEFLRESQFHRIEGALKHCGLIHLWEKSRFMKEDIRNISNKKKAKIIKKAKKMRLYPHTLEKHEKTTVKQPMSKVLWSEFLMKKNILGSEEMDCNVLHQYFMEFDLGECMLQFMGSENENDTVNKTVMAFRSLEITALL